MTLFEKQELIDAIEDEFLKGFDGINRRVFDAILNKLFTFQIREGKFVETQDPILLLGELKREVKQILATSEYQTKVDQLLRDMDKIHEANLAVQKGYNKLDVAVALIKPIQAQYAAEIVDGLVNTGIDAAFTKPMTEALMKYIVLGSNLSDTIDYLKEYVIGEPKKASKLERYATQIARDTLRGYDGQVNQKIATEYELDGYTYVGSIIDDSRGQCVRWSEKGFMTFAEIEREIEWAYANEGNYYNGHRIGGMMLGTTLSNFPLHCGGHNCRHGAVATYDPKRLKKRLTQNVQEPALS